MTTNSIREQKVRKQNIDVIGAQIKNAEGEQKVRRIPPRPLDGSFTIDEWCAKHRFCRQTFYNLQRIEKAPRTYTVGARRYISAEADQDWIEAREAEEAQKADAKREAIQAASKSANR